MACSRCRLCPGGQALATSPRGVCFLLAGLGRIPAGSAALCGRHVPGSPRSVPPLLKVPLVSSPQLLQRHGRALGSFCFLVQVGARGLTLTC